MNKILCLAALGCTVLSMSSTQATKPLLEFRDAALTETGVAFQPVFAIDWEQTARENFHVFDIHQPDRDQIRKNFFDPGLTAFFHYDAPLPAAKTNSYYYYVLSEAGVVPVTPDKLVGEIDYPSNADATEVGPPQFLGQMAAHAVSGQKFTDAGFVLIADKPLTFAFSEVAIAPDEKSIGISRHKVDETKVEYFYNDAEDHHISLEHHDLKYPGVKKSYLLRISGEPGEYLLVRWIPDRDCAEGCCEYSYSLIRLGPGKEIENHRRNDYGCDV